MANNKIFLPHNPVLNFNVKKNNIAWLETFVFLYMFFGEPAVHFSQFFPLLPLTEVSPWPSAIPDGNPQGDRQSAVGWGDAGFEPGTAGQQSGALPLSHHASLETHRCCRLLKKIADNKLHFFCCLFQAFQNKKFIFNIFYIYVYNEMKFVPIKKLQILFPSA